MAGANVFVTAGTTDKINKCIELGAKAGINYKETDFANEISRLTNGDGVDVVLDFIGARIPTTEFEHTKDQRTVTTSRIDERVRNRYQFRNNNAKTSKDNWFRDETTIPRRKNSYHTKIRRILVTRIKSRYTPTYH